MKHLLIFLIFFNPAKMLTSYEEIIFTRHKLTGYWETTEMAYMSANHEVWLIHRQNGLKRKAGYCRFKQRNIPGPIRVIAIFPKPGFKMKQNLFTYKVISVKSGTAWEVWDNNDRHIIIGE
jgi:hypothetical protein